MIVWEALYVFADSLPCNAADRRFEAPGELWIAAQKLPWRMDSVIDSTVGYSVVE